MPALRENQVLAYFRHIWKEANDHFTQYVEPEWEESKKLYLDSYAFTNKTNWQSQVQDPIADNIVTRMANYLTRILISTGDDYFSILHPVSIKAKGYHDFARVILEDNEYASIFSETIKYALVTSLYTNKVSYIYELESYPTYDPDNAEYSTTDDICGRVSIQRIEPWNIRLDPVGDQYIIEIKEVDLADFKRMAEANGWVNVKSVIADTLGLSDKSVPAKDNFRPKVTLHYVHTRCITDEAGLEIASNMHFIIANKQHMVHYCPNLLPRGKFPYVVGQPLKSIMSKYGRGYLTKLKSVITAYLDSLNLILDSFQLATLGVFEYNTNGIVNDATHQFTAEIVPGRMFPVTAPDTINQVYNPNIPAISLQMLYTLDRIIQNRSFQTEFFMGAPTSKGRPTASEVAIKTQESGGFFTDIASEIERAIIEPTVELVLATALIYMEDKEFFVDYTGSIKSPEAVSTITSAPFNERMQELRQAKVQARGISNKIMKASSFNKLIQIVSVLGNMPQILAALEPSKFVGLLFDAVDMFPDELFNTSLLDQLAMGMGQPAPGESQGQTTPENTRQGVLNSLTGG